MSSVQEVYQFLLYVFLGGIFLFFLGIFLLEIICSVESYFFVRPLVKGLIKIYVLFCIIIIIFNYKLFF